MKKLITALAAFLFAVTACTSSPTPTATQVGPTNTASPAPTLTPAPSATPMFADFYIGWLREKTLAQLNETVTVTDTSESFTIPAPGIGVQTVQFAIPFSSQPGNVDMIFQGPPEVPVGTVFAVTMRYPGSPDFLVTPIGYLKAVYPDGSFTFQLVSTSTGYVVVDHKPDYYPNTTRSVAPPAHPLGLEPVRSLAAIKSGEVWYYDPNLGVWLGFGVTDAFSNPPDIRMQHGFTLIPDGEFTDSFHWQIVDQTGLVHFSLVQTFNGLDFSVGDAGSDWLAYSPYQSTPTPEGVNGN